MECPARVSTPPEDTWEDMSATTKHSSAESPHLDGGGAGNGVASAGEGAARGHHQLDGVADDDGVVQQVPACRVLQRAAPHELAVAVAVARVWVLQQIDSRMSELWPNDPQINAPNIIVVQWIREQVS